MRLEEGILFHSRYNLVKLIGRGGFSEVWLAKDTWTGLEIVIKVYAPGNGMDQDGLKDFCKELAGVYNLNHSCLLKPQHVATWENMPYLLMTYCPEGSCSKHVGKMTEYKIWKLIMDVASGLAYLHGKDIIHQDIKPDNILIDPAGNYVITDFGVSTQARTVLRKSVIGAGFSGGTIAYMAPERFSKSPAPIKASDIWSLGAMVFELLEGQTPFGETGGGLQKCGADIPDMKKQISDALKFVIHKMLSKEPWDRPKAEDLVEWAKDPQKIEIDYDIIVEREEEQQGVNKQEHSKISNETINSAKVDELFLEVTPKQLTIAAEGGESTIYVKTNGTCILPNYATQDWFKAISNSQDSFIIKAEPNITGKTREWEVKINSYNSSQSQRKSESVLIKQASLPKKSSFWWWVLGLGGLLFFIILIGIGSNNEKPTPNGTPSTYNGKQEDNKDNKVLSDYNTKITLFDNTIKNASYSSIDDLERAYNILKNIKEIENNHRFITPQYYDKYLEYNEKYNKIQDEINNRINDAVPDSPTRKRNTKLLERLKKIKL